MTGSLLTVSRFSLAHCLTQGFHPAVVLPVLPIIGINKKATKLREILRLPFLELASISSFSGPPHPSPRGGNYQRISDRYKSAISTTALSSLQPKPVDFFNSSDAVRASGTNVGRYEPNTTEGTDNNIRWSGAVRLQTHFALPDARPIKWSYKSALDCSPLNRTDSGE